MVRSYISDPNIYSSGQDTSHIRRAESSLPCVWKPASQPEEQKQHINKFV
jgi:hypothetical protein